MTDNLDRGQHISEIKSKTTLALGFHRRNLVFTPRQTQAIAYKTLVRPQLEYASPVWQPHVAARWTFRRWQNKSSVSDMLDELEWPSLEARRKQSSLTFFYKKHSDIV